jgi:hypothetical protein
MRVHQRSCSAFYVRLSACFPTEKSQLAPMDSNHHFRIQSNLRKLFEYSELRTARGEDAGRYRMHDYGISDLHRRS